MPTQIIFYERDTLAVLFADFLGDGGRQLPIESTQGFHHDGGKRFAGVPGFGLACYQDS